MLASAMMIGIAISTADDHRNSITLICVSIKFPSGNTVAPEKFNFDTNHGTSTMTKTAKPKLVLSTA